jgi:hypothetical protein
VVPVLVQPTAGHARALEAAGAGWGCVGIACLGSWQIAILVCVLCVCVCGLLAHTTVCIAMHGSGGKIKKCGSCTM